MSFAPASAASLAAFVTVLLLVLGCLLGAIQHAYRSFKITALFALPLRLWLGVQSALVVSGRLLLDRRRGFHRHPRQQLPKAFLVLRRLRRFLSPVSQPRRFRAHPGRGMELGRLIDQP